MQVVVTSPQDSLHAKFQNFFEVVSRNAPTVNDKLDCADFAVIDC